MIELPNNKISRNLPEQVGFNTKKIQEIIEFLNESGMKDLVVNLEADSGALTNEQYAVLELSPSYIVLNGRVFYKALEDGTNIDFFDLSAPSISAGVSSQTVKRIRVVEATKNYSTTDVVLSSYTKDAVDTALAAKADLSGATFTGAVEALSLKQSQPNKSFDFSYSNVGVLTIVNTYTKALIINGEIHFIVNLKITVGESNYTGGGFGALCIIDEATGSKIFDADGKALSEAALTTYCPITAATGYLGKNDSQDLGSSFRMLIQRDSNNLNRINVSLRGIPTLNANSVYFLSARVQLSLL